MFIFFTLIVSSFINLSCSSTIAISQTRNITVVCGLLPTTTSTSQHLYELNCISFPIGTTHHFPAAKNPYSAIAAGDGFLCALSSPFSSNLSTIRCWDFDPRMDSVPNPKTVYSGPFLSSMSAGGNQVCGIVEGKIRCWRRALQLDVPVGFVFKKVAVSATFVCALSDGGSDGGSDVIKCFGRDNQIVHNAPRRNKKFTNVAAGKNHACAILVDGKFVCWGSGAPRQSELPKGKILFVSLALGNRTTCALDNLGIVHCLGDGIIGLPDDLVDSRFLNIEIRGHVLCGVLLSNYSLICWNFDDLKHGIVFKQVLPGPCASSCPCYALPGSGIFCSNGQAVCSQWCPNQHSDNKLVFIIIGSVVAFAFVSAAVFVFYKLRQRMHPHQPSVIQGPDRQGTQFESTVKEFSMSYLSSITGNFSDNHKIGTGGFGSVYRAELNEEGIIVAVKRAGTSTSASTLRQSQIRDSAFYSELSLLSRVHHKNLVRLFGYCKEGSERILVYEYMNNETLRDHLHRKFDAPTLDTWTARINVALDAARGIEYLHTYAVPPIIHRDIKSSNILLDDLKATKVSDFGLSLLTPNNPNDVNVPIAGTIGYIDPEYYELQQLTTKSDVYSFGVVLLEILSGRKVIQTYEESCTPKNVKEYAIPYIEADDIQHMLDAHVGSPTPREMDAVVHVSYLAVDCVKQNGRDRPTMTDVVNRLERALGA